jgi:TolB-like protein
LFFSWLSPVDSQDSLNQPTGKGLASAGASVAILDLFNLSNKADYDQWESLWGRGMRRASFTKNSLKIIPYPTILEALKDLKIDDYYIAPEQVPPLAKKLGADFVVLGSFTVSNETIAASIKVVDGKTGRLLKEETRIRQADQPNEFTNDLSNALLRMLLGEEKKEPTPNPTETEQSMAPPTTEAGLPKTTEGFPPPEPQPFQEAPVIPRGGEVTIVQPMGQEEPIEEGTLMGTPAPPVYSPPPAVPYQAPNLPPPVMLPQPQPQTIVKPIEAEIPSLPRTDMGPQLSTALQSPFQPLPVIPAPPPPRPAYLPPPQPSGAMMPPGGYNPQMGPGMMTTPQQPMSQPPPAPQGPVRRFFNWVSKPFRPAEPLPPPQVAMPSQPMTNPQAMQPPMPQPIPTPAPSGNPVTRFFGRLFGRGQG